ncbi:MAG: TetR/AcrR family transcriptional regulator [Ruthenibacterium sp.]
MARNKYPEETVRLILEQALALFIQKGYDDTSIQDIIDRLGGLSKGAIYHHFKSKEEIFEAVCNTIGQQNMAYFDGIRDDQSKSGLEKLKMMLRAGYQNPNCNAVIAVGRRIMNDPRFFQNEITEIYKLVVPFYVQPVIQQGIADGSLKTEYPKELAEVLITLINIWANPAITKTTPEEMRRKLLFLDKLLHGIGLALLDSEMLEQYVELCRRYNE